MGERQDSDKRIGGRMRAPTLTSQFVFGILREDVQRSRPSKVIDVVDHPNAGRVRVALESIVAGDPKPWGDLVADDVKWHVIGGRTIEGKDAVARELRMIDDVQFSVDIHDVLANDDHVVALLEVTLELGEDVLIYRTAEIYHISNDKLTERWSMAEDTQAINAFFRDSHRLQGDTPAHWGWPPPPSTVF